MCTATAQPPRTDLPFQKIRSERVRGSDALGPPADAPLLGYPLERPGCSRGVEGSRWASPSSKRLLGRTRGHGWVRLPCTSATHIQVLLLPRSRARAWRETYAQIAPRPGSRPDAGRPSIQRLPSFAARASTVPFGAITRVSRNRSLRTHDFVDRHDVVVGL